MISGFSSEVEDSIYDMSDGANFILDEDHNLIAANDCFFKITDLEYDKLEEGLNLLTLVPDDEVLLFINFFKKRLNDPYNSPKTSEFRILDSKNNEHKLILTAARIPETRKIFISSVEPGRYFSQVETRKDVAGDGKPEEYNSTSAKLSERPLDQYFHFSYLVEHQHEPVFVMVGDVITYINEAGVRFFGKDNRYDIIGKSPLEFLEKSSKAKMVRIFEKMKTRTIGHPIEDSITIRRGDVIDIEVSSVPVIYEGLAGLQYLIRDISSLKRSEQMAVLRSQQIEIVNSVLKSTAAGFSLEEILEKILEEIIENFGFQSGVIYLKNNDSSKARLASEINSPVWFKERYTTINIREWPYNIIFYGGQPRYVENLPDKPPGVFDIKILEDLGAISYSGVPLFSENAVVGAVYVTKGEDPEFSPFEKAALEEIGKEVGAIVVKGIIEEKFENEYNTIRDLLGIALKENERIWNTIISQRWDSGSSIDEELNPRMGLINEVGPRMDIINNLRVIYDVILEESRPLRPVCIDSVIRSAIYHFADADIEYDRALYFVLADDNLSYVFINILNMFRLSQERFSLSIRHMISKEDISIIISDMGDSGTIDNIEEMLEIHPDEAIHPVNIPVYATKMLVSAYGGLIDIAVSKEGTKSIVITLKRYGRS